MTPDASASSQPERPDAFISYSRQDGEFVRGLVRALEARGKDVWVDLDDIPKSADWLARVEQGIESAKAVVVVLSPALAASQICGQEIRHAIEHNKRLIPILRTDVEPEQLFPELNAPNWILAREQDDGEAAFEELVGALETDLAWLEAHARLVSRSVEWDRQNRDGSLLLRGHDLGSARRWLAARGDHREQPTELQVEYIGASRRSALVRWAALGVAALGVAALAGFLLVQRERTRDEQGRAQRQQGLAESRRLSADSVAQLGSNTRRALAIALEAHAAASTPEATQALRQALMRPQREATLRVRGTGIWSARFLDADTVRARTEDGRILRWPVAGGQPMVLSRGPRPRVFAGSPPSRAANLLVRAQFEVRVVTSAKRTVVLLNELRGGRPGGSPWTAVLSPDGRRVLTAGYRTAADVWRVPARALRPPAGAYFQCAADARTFVATCDDRGRLATWPSDPSKPSRTLLKRPQDGSYAPGDLDATVSVDGRWIFATSRPQATITVISPKSGDIVRTHKSPTYIPPVLSGDGRRVYVPKEDSPEVQDATTGEVVATLPFRSGDVFAPVAFNSSGDRIAVYLGDGIEIWDTVRERRIGKLPAPKDQLDALGISPSGRYVAMVEAADVSIYRSDGGSLVRRYPITDERINKIEFSRDDAFFLTAGNNTARVTEIKTRRSVAEFAGHRGLLSASFGPGARTVVTVGRDGWVLVHDCPACAPPATLVERARAALRVRPVEP